MDPETSAIDLKAESAIASEESTSCATTSDDAPTLKKRRKGKRSDTEDHCSDSLETDGRIAQLETQLLEKEQLVVALTERLEQAAEQLDRFRRTGSDRSLRIGGGIPAELVESQTSLVEKLQHVLEQWEDLQAATALGRLEVQVSELRDLIASQVLVGKPGNSLRDDNSESLGIPRTTEGDSSGKEPDAGDEVNGWEKLKAEILARDNGTETSRAERTGAQPEPSANETVSCQPSSDASDASDASDDETPAAAAGQEANEGGDVSPIASPEPVAFDTADLEQLRMAIESRDAYISYLLKKLSTTDTVEVPTDWQALQNVPDALQNRVQQLAEQLEEKLRFAAVDFSLERARLGREEARLQQREEQLEAKTQRLGLDLTAADSSNLPKDEETKRKRRWLRFLARVNTEDKTPEPDACT